MSYSCNCYHVIRTASSSCLVRSSRCWEDWVMDSRSRRIARRRSVFLRYKRYIHPRWSLETVNLKFFTNHRLFVDRLLRFGGRLLILLFADVFLDSRFLRLKFGLKESKNYNHVCYPASSAITCDVRTNLGRFAVTDCFLLTRADFNQKLLDIFVCDVSCELWKFLTICKH